MRCAVVPLALLVGLPGGTPQPEKSRPAEKPDAACAVSSVAVQARVRPGPGDPVGSSVIAFVHFTAPQGARAAARNAVLTEVLDRGGKDVFVHRKISPLRPDEERRELGFALCSGFTSGRDDVPDPTAIPQGEAMAPPEAIRSVRGEFDAIVARNVVRQKVELAAAEEPVELVPGLTFLMTDAEQRGDSYRVGFEVRIKRRRGKDAGEAGLEPIFGGLLALGENGKAAHAYRDGLEVTTRDEYILIVKDHDLYPGKVAGWQVCAMGGLERVRLGFSGTDVKVEETRPVPVGPPAGSGKK